MQETMLELESLGIETAMPTRKLMEHCTPTFAQPYLINHPFTHELPHTSF
jgi:hypothetical protein